MSQILSIARLESGPPPPSGCKRLSNVLVTGSEERGREMKATFLDLGRICDFGFIGFDGCEMIFYNLFVSEVRK